MLTSADWNAAQGGYDAGPPGIEEAGAVVREVAVGVDAELGRDALPHFLLTVGLEHGVGEGRVGGRFEDEPLAGKKARWRLEELDGVGRGGGEDHPARLDAPHTRGLQISGDDDGAADEGLRLKLGGNARDDGSRAVVTHVHLG